ncbi:hypothetical protein [Citreimonas sp.]|uniref:hypothetical protein n=1 Tax=Citreimonas sp. TaxID=3036715 RepID=UPI004058FA3F
MPRAIKAGLVAAAFATAAPFAALQAQEPFFSVATDDEVGRYIVGPGGRPVYMFDTGARGGDYLPPLESCLARCREAWPPVFVDAETNLVVPDDLDSQLTGMVPESEGERLVASYNGYPLFYYAREDESEGPSGHGIHTHGGWWITIAPDGEPIRTGTIPQSND